MFSFDDALDVRGGNDDAPPRAKGVTAHGDACYASPVMSPSISPLAIRDYGKGLFGALGN